MPAREASGAPGSRGGALLTYGGAAALTGLSKRTLHRMVRAGRFVQPVVIGSPGGRESRRFRRADIEAWLAALPPA